MRLGRLSVKKIFGLVCGGAAVSMLTIGGVFFAITDSLPVVICGLLLTVCAIIWLFILMLFFRKQLSVFTNDLCRIMDHMISGS